jgi:hypothetical protein
LFDQQFGLIPNAPVFLCAFAGLAVMFWRGAGRLAMELLAIAVPYFLTAASFTSWWGGTTPPARYFVPITLLLALPTAFWFATAKSASMRLVSVGALFISLLVTITIASVDRGAFVFNFRDGLSRVALWLTPVVDLTKALPSLFQNPPATAVSQAAIWIAALLLAVVVAAVLERWGRAAVIIGFGLTLQATAMAAVASVWRTNGAAAVTPYAGGAAVLRRYDVGHRQLAVGYRPVGRISGNELLARITLARMLSDNPRTDSPSMVHLPAGTYELTGATTGSAHGHLRLRTDRVSGPLADWDVASFEPIWTRRLTIPVGVAGLTIDLDPAARAALHNVSMRAVSVSGPLTDLGRREARRASRYGSALLFFLDGDAWMEPTGAWIGGDSRAEFAIAPDAPAPLQVLVRNGPVDNDVAIESGRWRDRLSMKPGEEQVVELPRDDRQGLTLLTMAARNGFRPAAVDSTSDDVRFLGVWMEIR